MPAYTTIQVTPETRRKLMSLREYPRETYEEVLNKLMSLIPEGDEEGRYKPEFRASLLRGHLDITQGRTVSHSELKKKLRL